MASCRQAGRSDEQDHCGERQEVGDLQEYDA